MPAAGDFLQAINPKPWTGGASNSNHTGLMPDARDLQQFQKYSIMVSWNSHGKS